MEKITRPEFMASAAAAAVAEEEDDSQAAEAEYQKWEAQMLKQRPARAAN